MALQSSFYPVDGRSRTYPQTKPIPTKQHAVIYSRLVGTNIWVLLGSDGWSLINNSVVLKEAFSASVYDQIEVRVGDSPDGLTDTITDIAVVAGLSDEIISIIADKATLDSLYADKATLDSLYADKATLDSLYADKAKLDSLYADKATLDGLFASKAAINTNANNIGNIGIIGNDLANSWEHIEDNGSIGDAVEGGTGISLIEVVSDNITNVNTNANNIASIDIIGNDLANSWEYIEDNGSIGDAVTGGTGISLIEVVSDNIASINTNAANIIDIQNAEENAAQAAASVTAAAGHETNTLGYWNNIDTQVTAPLIAIAADLINTQTIVAEHHTFA